MKEFSIKSIKKEFSDAGVFHTPPELALLIKQYVKDKPENVYDPTCGAGSLLSVFEDSVRKYGQELNPVYLEEAKKNKNFEGYAGDTLSNPYFTDKRFDCIVANPPFSIKWTPFTDDRFKNSPALPPQSKADYAFILHCLYLLKDTGIFICLCFPGILYRGNKEYEIRKWIVENNWIERIVRIPGKTFTDTSIETALIVFRKDRINTDIIFEDRVLQKEKIVKLSEIQNNDFNLAVSQYIQENIIKEKIDPVALEYMARKSFIKKLKAELEFSYFVSIQEDNVELKTFVDDIQKTIEEFKLKYM